MRSPEDNEQKKIGTSLWMQVRKVIFNIERAFFKSLVDPVIIKDDDLPVNGDHPVCYILESSTDIEFILLEKICAKLKLPPPTHPLFDQTGDLPTYVKLDYHSIDPPRIKQKNKDLDTLLRLQRMVERNEVSDVILVPVIFFWNRFPMQERSLLQLILFRNWAWNRMASKLFEAIFYRKMARIQYSKPLSIRAQIEDEDRSNMVTRKIYRLLRVHFRQQRQPAQGPVIANRNGVIQSVVRAEPVRELAKRYAVEENKSLDKIERDAISIANEIAADMSYLSLRFSDFFLRWWWTKMYDGVQVHGIARVSDIAKTHEIIYLPCHRSYMDFILLSYLLHHNGLCVPYIAAGINLNMPIVGRLLRKCGAFFMRRTFNNPLYSAVFQEYLHLMMARGHSLEFFIEGGRTRTGLLLPPKRGLLGIVCKIRAYRARMPIALVPVYFGYEKIMEDGVYLREMKGKKKKQESLLRLIRSFKHLRGFFGEPHVSFGSAIVLDDYLKGQANQEWTPQNVQCLAEDITTRINQAVTILPINLIACCLASQTKGRLHDGSVRRQLGWMIDLLQRIPVSDQVVISYRDADSIIERVIQSGVLTRSKEAQDSHILQVNEGMNQLLTWYRNNTIHTLMMPAIVGTIWQRMPAANKNEVTTYCKQFYPYIKERYFLPWKEDEIEAVLQKCHAGLEETGFLSVDDGGELQCNFQKHSDYARLLAFIASSVLNKFSIIGHVLRESVDLSRTIDLAELTSQYLHVAEKTVTLGEVHMDFVDRDAFLALIKQLLQRGELVQDDDGCLRRGENAFTIAAELDWLTHNEPVRQSDVA